MRFVVQALQLSAGFQPYPYFVRRGFPLAARFLVKLLLLLAALVVAGMLPRLLPLTDDAAEWLGRSLPDAAIEESRLQTTASLPHAVTNRAIVVRLDLDARVPELSPELPAAVVFAGDRLLFGFYSGEAGRPASVSELPYKGLPEGRLDPAYFHRLFRQLIYQTAPLAVLILFASGAISLFLLALSFTLVTSVADRMVGRSDLSFGQMLSIATYALAPPLLLTSGYLLLGMWRMPLGIVFFALYGVFLIGGSYACRRDALGLGPPGPP